MADLPNFGEAYKDAINAIDWEALRDGRQSVLPEDMVWLDAEDRLRGMAGVVLAEDQEYDQ